MQWHRKSVISGRIAIICNSMAIFSYKLPLVTVALLESVSWLFWLWASSPAVIIPKCPQDPHFPWELAIKPEIRPRPHSPDKFSNLLFTLKAAFWRGNGVKSLLWYWQRRLGNKNCEFCRREKRMDILQFLSPIFSRRMCFSVKGES